MVQGSGGYVRGRGEGVTAPSILEDSGLLKQFGNVTSSYQNTRLAPSHI